MDNLKELARQHARIGIWKPPKEEDKALQYAKDWEYFRKSKKEIYQEYRKV